MPTTTPTLADTLETLIDANGLAAVLEAIVDTCDAKAQHLRENWQDATSARDWERTARRVIVAQNEATESGLTR